MHDLDLRLYAGPVIGRYIECYRVTLGHLHGDCLGHIFSIDGHRSGRCAVAQLADLIIICSIGQIVVFPSPGDDLIALFEDDLRSRLIPCEGQLVDGTGLEVLELNVVLIRRCRVTVTFILDGDHIARRSLCRKVGPVGDLLILHCQDLLASVLNDQIIVGRIRVGRNVEVGQILEGQLDRLGDLQTDSARGGAVAGSDVAGLQVIAVLLVLYRGEGIAVIIGRCDPVHSIEEIAEDQFADQFHADLLSLIGHGEGPGLLVTVGMTYRIGIVPGRQAVFAGLFCFDHSITALDLDGGLVRIQALGQGDIEGHFLSWQGSELDGLRDVCSVYGDGPGLFFISKG